MRSTGSGQASAKFRPWHVYRDLNVLQPRTRPCSLKKNSTTAPRVRRVAVESLVDSAQHRPLEHTAVVLVYEHDDTVPMGGKK